MNETSIGNMDIEKQLDELPDIVAAALEKWRIATLDRQKCEGLLYAATKGANPEMKATEIKAIIDSNPTRYDAVLNEIKAESDYKRVEDKLLNAKKRASLRVAF